MVLRSVGHNDEGTYICTAENGVGLPDTAAAVLTVLRKFLIIFTQKIYPISSQFLSSNNVEPMLANIRLMFVD